MDITQLSAFDAVTLGFKVGYLTCDQFLASSGRGNFTKDFA